MSLLAAGVGSTQTPLRVLLVVWSGNIGGAETQTASLAHHLRLRGLDAAILAVCSAAPLVDRDRARGVPFDEAGYSRGLHALLSPMRFIRAVTRHRPHIVILAQGAPLAPLIRLAVPRIAVIHVQHTGHFFYSYPRSALEMAGRVCQRLFVDADVAVSDFVYAEMAHALRSRNLKRIHNGVDVEFFRPAGAERARGPAVVGFAGRLGRGKGVEDLIHAASAVRLKSEFEVVLAGSGPCRDEFQGVARELPCGSRFRFVGQVSDMAGFWNGCDIAVVPTNGLIESFGMVAAEAMACGKPVIAARAGGLIEVVSEGETGLLFNPGDRDALTQCLERYLSSPELMAIHGVAGRRRIEERFDIRTKAAEYEALCRDVLTARS